MIPPLDKVLKQAPNWFLVAIEACGGGTPDLGFFSGGYVFIGIFGFGLTSGGSPSHPRGRGRTQGVGRTLHPRGRLGNLLAQLFYSGSFFWSIKNRQKLARQLDSIWYSFFVKLKNNGKTETGTGLWVNRLVPKII